ncbi:MAG: sigma-E processing peptidase SpoIIGA [Clostridia bacterium]
MNDVYIDVLIFENMVMNYVILHITSLVASRRSKWYRILAGSAIGTFYAVLSLWLSAFLHALIGKILLSALMVLVTYFPRKIKDFLRLSAIFYGVTFLFAGISFAVLLTGRVKSASNILATVCVGYLLVLVIARCIQKRKHADQCAAKVFIQFDKAADNGVWLPAIIDTGNSLRDPFTGTSVIVAELGALENLLPEELLKYLRENGSSDILNDASAISSVKGWERRFRLIPYNSVGNENGILPGFKADVVRVSEDSGAGAELNDVVVCLYEKALSEDEKYRALLAPDMIA